MWLSGRGLMLGSYVTFRWGFGGRQLCALLVGVGCRSFVRLWKGLGGRQ
jgi:hypothetical protein